MTKQPLRQLLLQQRRALTPSCWQTASETAQRRLLALDIFQSATVIALYAPIQQEIGTELLFRAAVDAGKQVLFPAVCATTLQFFPVDSHQQLEAGSYGIPEPVCPGGADQVLTADLLVVPGVAFDLQGHRIGFGKGYYDRYLSSLQHRPLLVGLCHDFQLLKQVPSEQHDIRMQYLVTDKRVVTVVTGSTPD